MRSLFVRGRVWWNWFLGSDAGNLAPSLSPVSRRRSKFVHRAQRRESRHRSLGYETLEPLCMLTSSIVISGPQSVMEPTVPGTTTNAHVSISLSMSTFGDSGTVQWATQAVAGGATPGDDFTASSGTLSLSFMNPQFYVDIPIKYDTVSESPEPFQVVLSNATGSLAIMVGSTTINITDNNPPPPPPPPPGVPTVNFSGAASYFM